MSILLELSYGEHMTLDLSEILMVHGIQFTDVKNLFVKWNTLAIELNNGTTVEHNIHHRQCRAVRGAYGVEDWAVLVEHTPVLCQLALRSYQRRQVLWVHRVRGTDWQHIVLHRHRVLHTFVILPDLCVL